MQTLFRAITSIVFRTKTINCHTEEWSALSWTLEGNTLTSRTVVSQECIELPHIDYGGFRSSPEYRYVYGCGINSDHEEGFYNQLVKINMQTGEGTNWFIADNYPGEPVFIPHPDRTSEDDGVLLSVVLNADQKHSYLLILDAKTMDEIARAELPHSVLFGYHGSFYQ